MMLKLLNLLPFLIILTLSSCQKTDISGHWHFFRAEDPKYIIHTWDIEGDSLIIDKYNFNYGPYASNIKIKDNILTADMRWYEGIHEYVYGFVEDTLVLILEGEDGVDNVIAGKAVRRNNCSYEEDVLFHLNSDIDLLTFSETDTISRYSVLSEIFIGKPKEEEKFGSRTRIQVNDVFIRPHHIDKYIEEEIYPLDFTGVPTIHALFIDSETEMGFVDEIRIRLAKYQQPIAYITEGNKEDITRYQALIKKTPHFCTNTLQEAAWQKDSLTITVDTTDFKISFPQKQLCQYETDITTKNNLLIHLNEANQYFINNTRISLPSVADAVTKYIKENNGGNIIVLEYNSRSLYKHYLALLNEVLKAEKQWKTTAGTKTPFQILEVCSSNTKF